MDNLNKKLHYIQSEHNPQAMEDLLKPKNSSSGRLLSEQEAKSHNCKADELALKLQLAKTDKEWVEWVADEIIEFALNFNRSAAFHETLLRVWNNRKKDIGLCLE